MTAHERAAAGDAARGHVASVALPGRSPRPTPHPARLPIPGALRKAFLGGVDLALSPYVFWSGLVLKLVRRTGVANLPLCRAVLTRIGVFPIADHYYEPLFNPARLRHPLDQERDLPGIDWNVDAQLAFLAELEHRYEVLALPRQPTEELGYALANLNFGEGDAEYWYSLIRTVKPRRIVEVGSGHSTLLAQQAIRRNRHEDPRYVCEHTCVEPYEMPWLERTGARIVRRRVEDVPLDRFRALDRGDVLFIDSSHVVRPQGDVLFEILTILPLLRPGVIVHLYDVFSPRDYPAEWVKKEVRLWNEQYLVEAFLTHNRDWEILGALNYLQHHHPEALRRVCPHLGPDGEPRSFYIRRVR
jgi:hypothetical protein